MSPPRNSSPLAASTSRIRTPSVALGRVVHLEVGDVDAELGGQREDLGGGAGAVGDRDAHLGQVGGSGDTATAGWPAPARARVEHAEQRVAVAVTDDVADARRARR